MIYIYIYVHMCVRYHSGMYTYIHADEHTERMTHTHTHL